MAHSLLLIGGWSHGPPFFLSLLFSLSLSPRGSYFILCIWNGLSLRRVMVKIPAETSLPWEALSDQPGATPPFLLSLLSSCV